MKKEEIAAMVIDDIKDIIYISDIENYDLLYVNDSTLEVLGYTEESQWKNKPCYKVLQGLDEPCPFCTNHLLKKDSYYDWEHYNEKVGRYFYLKDKLITMMGRDARLEVAVDITENRRASEELQRKLLREETLVECVKTLYENKDTERAINHLLSIIARYHCAERAYIFEIDEERDVLNNTYEWCNEGVTPQIDFLQEVALEVIDRWMVRFERDGEFYITSVNGEVDKDSDEYKILQVQGIESLMAAPLRIDGKIVGFLGVDNPKVDTDTLLLMQSVAAIVMDDIEKRKTMAKMYEFCYVDRLTTVGNRHAYTEYIRELEKKKSTNLGIVFADINGLKVANDTYGHEYGDMLIKEVSQLLVECFRENIYRIGGDEFVVFCVDVEQETFEAKVEQLRELQKGDKKNIVSIGSTWMEAYGNIEEQIAYADKLMYINKQEYYSTSKKKDGKYKENLSQQLLAEIKEGCFRVYLQPKIDLNSGKVKGAEALVRKIAADGSLIKPDKFIWKYEEEDIIRHVDFFVLDTVCTMIADWQKKKLAPLRISVNFSRITLMEHDIVEKIKRICKNHDVSPEYICIEVTETVEAIGEQELKKLVNELNEEGFKVSLDDFGTKYSSLAMLTSIDFNEVKLDRSLICDLEENEKKRIIAQYIIEMCKELSPVFSVAEGIENEEQKELLKQFKCTEGQGFYFAKPMDAESFTEKYLKSE